MLPPTAVPALRRKAAAVMSWSASLESLFAPTSASASCTLPAVAVRLTCPSAKWISPTVMSVPANSRAVAVAPVLAMVLLALCLISPAVACTSIEPLPAAVLLVRMSAVPVRITLRAASTLTLPLPLSTSALSVMSLPAPCACSSTLPLPCALIAVSSASPSLTVMAPPATSTMCPSRASVTRSLCARSSTPAVLASASKPVTVTATVSTVTASSSLTKMPAPTSVPRLSALSVLTSVVRCLPLAPIASSASMRKFVAVTFFVLPAALSTLPPSATRLTLVATTLPTTTSVAAFNRTLLPVAVIVAVPNCVSAPPSASISTVPAPPVLRSALTFTPAAAVTVR